MPNTENDVASTRFGAAAAISGAILLVAGTMLHPMDADPNDTITAFAEYAADEHWVSSHLGQNIVNFIRRGVRGIRGTISPTPGTQGWLPLSVDSPVAPVLPFS